MLNQRQTVEGGRAPNEETLSEPLQMFNRALAVIVIDGDMCYDIKLTSYVKNIASNLGSKHKSG